MLSSTDKISYVPRDSSSFHTGMMGLSLRAEVVQENRMVVLPYMYASVSNKLFSCEWIVRII